MDYRKLPLSFLSAAFVAALFISFQTSYAAGKVSRNSKVWEYTTDVNKAKFKVEDGGIDAGWYPAGQTVDVEARTLANKPTVGASVKAAVGKYGGIALDVVVALSGSSIASAIVGALLTGAAGKLIEDWASDNGVVYTDGTLKKVESGYYWVTIYGQGHYATAQEACDASVLAQSGGVDNNGGFLEGSGPTQYSCGKKSWGTGGLGYVVRNGSGVSTATPISDDDAITLLGTKTMDGSLVQAILDAGQKISTDGGTVTVSGPSSITTKSTSTTDSDGKSVTSVTTTQLSYTGDTVNIGPSTTTTTTNNIDGSTKTETTIINPTDSTEDDKPECAKSPDTLGCQDVGSADDVEDSDLDQEDKDISFDLQNFGSTSGSCPADKTVTLTKGTTLHFSYSAMCMYAEDLRPVVIALSYLIAALIVVGIKTRD